MTFFSFFGLAGKQLLQVRISTQPSKILAYILSIRNSLYSVTQKPESRPSSSESSASIIKAEDWRRILKLVKDTVSDAYEKKAQQLHDTMLHLSTENILLKAQVEGLQRTIININKRQAKKKPLLLDLPAENEGDAIFFSPSKVQQARDLQVQKDENAAQEQARKDDKKLQQQLAKQAKELEKVEKAQIWQKKREQRQQEAIEKQRLKDEQELAKLADLQLQKDVLATPKPCTKRTNPISKQSKPKSRPTAPLEAAEEVTATNRRGRQIRLPERYR